jgi:hypothetical protein
MAEEPVTQEQLQAAWKEHLERQKVQSSPAAEEHTSATTELPSSPAEGRLQDPKTQKYITYSEAKEIWNAKRGIGTSHTSEPLTAQQKIQEAQYQERRADWFARMGRRDPLIAKKIHNELTKKRENEYR